MEMTDEMQKNDIVEEYKIGDTTILISKSSYKDRTPEEIEDILKRVTVIGWEISESAIAEGSDL